MADLPERADGDRGDRGDRAPTPALRASDQDRDRVAEQLRDAAGEGRLNLGELEERLELTFQAKTYGELAVITEDLPGTAPAVPAASPSAAAPVLATEDVRDVSATLGSNNLSGRFVCPAHIVAKAVLGEVKIDFTEAIVPRTPVVIDADAILGEVKLYFPEGVDVRMEPGRTILGERKSKLPPPSSPEAPVFVVRGTVILGEVKIKGRAWQSKLRDALGL